MAEMKRVGDLEVAEDLKAQRRNWVFAAAVQGGQIRLWINREYLKGIQLQEVDPQPDTVEASPERLIYVFDAEEGPEDRPTEITFELEPDEMGTLAGRVGLDGEASRTFEQFVYP